MSPAIGVGKIILLAPFKADRLRLPNGHTFKSALLFKKNKLIIIFVNLNFINNNNNNKYL